MDELDRLLAAAEAAGPSARIDYRDPIAALGPEAVRRLEPWLLDNRLCFFALVTIVRAAQAHGAQRVAADALARAQPRCPAALRPLLDGHLARLAPTRRPRQRKASDPTTLREAGLEPLPPALRAVVTQWVQDGRPAQPARAWHQALWRREVPAHRAWLDRQPRAIGRSDIRPLCRGAARDAGGAEQALVAMMTWGAIDFGYRCRWTRDMLATPRALDRLVAAARTLATDGPTAAYRRLHHTGDCHVDRLGQSFLTKWLYFCQPDGQAPRALILDSYVNDWLGREAGLAFSRGRGTAAGYDAYLRSMHAWAGELGCDAEHVELCIFREEATRGGSGWS
jgi:hypothetical protein